MIREFYDKNELGFSIIWIIAYCILASIGDNISDDLGISKVITLPILLVLSVILFLFIKRNNFMFMMIYYRTKSLLPCIITHGVFNALSAFANETGLTSKEQIISCILITLISGAYALYIALEIKK